MNHGFPAREQSLAVTIAAGATAARKAVAVIIGARAAQQRDAYLSSHSRIHILEKKFYNDVRLTIHAGKLPSTPATTFPKFSHLPIELRTKIWKAALPFHSNFEDIIAIIEIAGSDFSKQDRSAMLASRGYGYDFLPYPTIHLPRKRLMGKGGKVITLGADSRFSCTGNIKKYRNY